MTVIAALIDNDTLYMASDTQMTNGSDATNLSPSVPKVFFRGDLLVGVSGSVRALNLIRYRLDVPERDTDDDMEYISISVVDSIRQLLKDGGVAEQTNGSEFNGDSDHYSHFLIGYRGRIFRVGSDYNVTERSGPYNAIGSGEDFALGSLYSTPGLPPEYRLRTALLAAMEFNVSVGGTVSIRATTWTPPETS